MEFDSLIFMFGSIMEYNQKYFLTFLYKFYILTPPSSLSSPALHFTSFRRLFLGENFLQQIFFLRNFFLEKYVFWKKNSKK